MIFELYYFLILAGYSACGLLLGAYMIRYGEATELQLGFVFTIQPFTVLARPLICSIADRSRSHKKWLSWCILTTFLAYLPFIVIPFLIAKPTFGNILTPQICFWIFVVAHLIGSLGFCGIRSLGDALVVNYAKRVGSHYTSFRKYGALSFGLCGFLLGQINQGWILPDFVPTMILHVSCMALLSLLVYLWPDEYFVMVSHNNEDLTPIPSRKETLMHMRSRLFGLVFCSSKNTQAKRDEVISTNSSSLEVSISETNHKSLSFRQQVDIFMLLLKRDVRIVLFLSLILYNGMVGYGPQNFVFTYADLTCHEKNTCDASKLAGLMMICYCLTEATCYMIVNVMRKYWNHILLIEITFVSLALHYYFYGFLLNQLSPYFFLVESLHGLEYSFSLATAVELGHKFASEVELLLPDLIKLGIVGKHDNHELVKVSLMATMNSFFTLVYDGAGSIIGAFLYGIIVDKYSFTTAWIVNGSLATFGFFLVIAVILIGKCFNIKPNIRST